MTGTAVGTGVAVLLWVLLMRSVLGHDGKRASRYERLTPNGRFYMGRFLMVSGIAPVAWFLGSWAAYSEGARW